MNYSTTTRIYTYVWSKYRPVVLKLMVDSADGPQQYKFSPHEFRGINPKEKGGYSFNFQVFQGKSVKSLKTSVVAQDLLGILQQSKKALELTEICTYEFALDKHFMLHVTKLDKAKEEVVAADKTADQLVE